MKSKRNSDSFNWINNSLKLLHNLMLANTATIKLVIRAVGPVDSKSLTRLLLKTPVGQRQQDVLHPFGWDWTASGETDQDLPWWKCQETSDLWPARVEPFQVNRQGGSVRVRAEIWRLPQERLQSPQDVHHGGRLFCHVGSHHRIQGRNLPNGLTAHCSQQSKYEC